MSLGQGKNCLEDGSRFGLKLPLSVYQFQKCGAGTRNADHDYSPATLTSSSFSSSSYHYYFYRPERENLGPQGLFQSFVRRLVHP